MPIYEYVCQRCKKQIDVFQKLNDPAPERCETCGAKSSMSRVVSRTSFILKGGGWYADLYSSSKKEESKAGESKTDGKAGPASSKADDKAPASTNGATKEKSGKPSSASAEASPVKTSSDKPATSKEK